MSDEQKEAGTKWEDIFRAGFHSNDYTLTEYLEKFYDPPKLKSEAAKEHWHGLRWVKASERLPIDHKIVSIKINGEPGYGWYEEGRFVIRTHSGKFSNVHYDCVEWLDETPAHPTAVEEYANQFK